MNNAFFFDRDGVVNVKLPGDYVKTIDEFKFKEDFFPLFKYIKEKGYLAVLVTNQQGIGKELMSEQDLATVHEYMQCELLNITGYKFDGIYFCPELALNASNRRKPGNGMFLDAVSDFDIDPNVSFTIGDSPSDAQAGKITGTTTILSGCTNPNVPDADYSFPDLFAALDKIRELI